MIGDPVASKRLMVSSTAASCSFSSSALLILPASNFANAFCRFNGRGIEPTGSVGMLLSRVNRRWDLSRAQKWWLRWMALQREEDKLSFEEFRSRSWALARDFPACIPDAPTPAKMSAQPSAERRK